MKNLLINFLLIHLTTSTCGLCPDPLELKGVKVAVWSNDLAFLVNSAKEVYQKKSGVWSKLTGGVATEIAVDSDQNLYIITDTDATTSSDGKTVQKYTSSTSIFALHGTNQGGTSITVDKSGNVNVTIGTDDSIMVSATDNAGAVTWSAGTGTNVGQISIGADGTIWMLGNTATASNYPVSKDTIGTVIAGAVGTKIAVAPDGNAWLINNAGEVFKYNGTGFDKMFDGMSDVSIGYDNTVWLVGNVAENGDYVVYKYGNCDK